MGIGSPTEVDGIGSPDTGVQIAKERVLLAPGSLAPGATLLRLDRTTSKNFTPVRHPEEQP
jgi:hypothetical protein